MPDALRGVRAALTCLQLLLLLSAANSRPHTWDQDRFQLENIKKGILERLGMPAPPVIRRQLDQESIQRAQRLYEQKVAELRGNRSREEEEEEGAVSRTRRLHRLTPTCKWPWLGVTSRPSHHPPTGHTSVPACPALGNVTPQLGDMTGHAAGWPRSSLSRTFLRAGSEGEAPLEAFCLKSQKKLGGAG